MLLFTIHSLLRIQIFYKSSVIFPQFRYGIPLGKEMRCDWLKKRKHPLFIYTRSNEISVTIAVVRQVGHSELLSAAKISE